MQELKSVDQFNSVTKAATSTLKVVEFTATWCGPCKNIAPWCDQLAATYPDVEFFKMDGELDDIGQTINLQAFPSFFFYKNGELVTSVKGTDKKSVRAMVVEHKGAQETVPAQATIVA